MAKRRRYTRKEIEKATERIIAAGKDLRFKIRGKWYILNVKMLAAEKEYWEGSDRVVLNQITTINGSKFLHIPQGVLIIHPCGTKQTIMNSWYN